MRSAPLSITQTCQAHLCSKPGASHLRWLRVVGGQLSSCQQQLCRGLHLLPKNLNQLLTAVSGCFRMFPDVFGCSRMFSDVFGCFQLFSDVFRCSLHTAPGPLSGVPVTSPGVARPMTQRSIISMTTAVNGSSRCQCTCCRLRKPTSNEPMSESDR